MSKQAWGLVVLDERGRMMGWKTCVNRLQATSVNNRYFFGHPQEACRVEIAEFRGSDAMVRAENWCASWLRAPEAAGGLLPARRALP